MSTIIPRAVICNAIISDEEQRRPDGDICTAKLAELYLIYVSEETEPATAVSLA